jgi:hypothetical protein
MLKIDPGILFLAFTEPIAEERLSLRTTPKRSVLRYTLPIPDTEKFGYFFIVELDRTNHMRHFGVESGVCGRFPR